MKKLIVTIIVSLGFAIKALAYDFQSGDLLYSIISTNPPQVSVDGHVDGRDAQGELVIPETVEYEQETFTVVSIRRKAFYLCEGLTGDLVIPNTITSISIEAFAFCTGFTGDLVIPNAITELGTDNQPSSGSFYGTFEECTGFSRLVLGDSLKIIGHCCFRGCSGFTGQLLLPDKLEEIWSCAFFNCSGFVGELNLPASLKRIEDCAFDGCSGFTGKLVFQDALEWIGEEAFAWCSGFADVEFRHHVFYENKYDGEVFKGWSFVELDIPEGWTTIKDWTFAYCRYLTKVHFPESLTVIENYAFDKCNQLCEIDFPGNLQTIGCGAFRCKNLKEIHLPKSLTEIRGWAFQCSGLAGDVIIPDRVERIETETFDSCVYIRRIVLGKSINCVYDKAFKNTRLESVVIKAVVPPELKYYSTHIHIPADLPITVPCGTLEAYQNAEGWREFTNIHEDITDILMASSSDESAGTVSILKEAICEDRTVKVEALPNDGWEFMYWEANGERVSIENPYSFTLEEDTELVAYFSGSGLDETRKLFAVFPNPTTNFVTITGQDLKAAEVFNTLGQHVATATGEGERLTVNLSEMPAGIYFVNVTDKEGRKCVRKVVKE